MSKQIKVGDTVYETDGIKIYESKIKNIVYDTGGIAFDERAIGKSVFLNRKDVERKQNEMSKTLSPSYIEKDRPSLAEQIASAKAKQTDASIDKNKKIERENER